MKVTVICVGKLKEKYLKEAVEEYSKRLKNYTKLEVIELSDEKIIQGRESLAIETEGDKILKKLNEDDFKIALCIEGKQMSSEELSLFIVDVIVEKNITFIIGGSVGISDRVLSLCHKRISFSKMTFPHQLMRVIFLEQIYRCFKIYKNEPYHK